VAEERRESLVRRDEVEAALAARRELGPDYERELADALAERIEQHLDERLLAREPARRERDKELALAIVSLLVAIPALAIAGGTAGLAGIVAVALAIVLVNVAFSRA
jgi:predicted Zn-dependent protease